MKKIMCFCLFIFGFLFLNIVDVSAANNLSMKNLTLECIYTDGGLYTSSFSGTNSFGFDKYVVNRTSYNLEGVDNNTANKGSSSYIVNNLYVGNKCQESLYVSSINLAGETEADEESGDSDSPVNFHKFGSELKPEDIGASNSWWDYLWPTRGGDADKVEDADQIKYSLVSERYDLKSDAPEPNATVYYVQKAEQVAGQNKYVAIMIYDNVILMQKDDRITRLEGEFSLYQGVTRNDDDTLSKEVPEEIYINSPEPQASTSTSSTVSYRFLDNQKTFSVSKTKDSTHVNKYTLTDDINKSDLEKSNALCDEILVNTSPYLKQVIKAIQLLVPIFLIILTALDIGKIVLTGNIDEELPKRKKIILIRFVVAIVFFFLPLFINMMTDWLIDSGAKNADSIEYINCLFE